MAIDPISAISGPLDTASFADDADAYGTKVLAEITQLINKVNELVTGVTNTNAETVTNASNISTNTAYTLDHEDRIDDLEDVSVNNTLDITATSTALTVQQCLDNRLIMMRKNSGSVTQYALLPGLSSMSGLAGCLPITIICSENAFGGKVGIDALGGEWADGTAGGPLQYITLDAGEAVTVVPVQRSGGTDAVWAIVGGNAGNNAYSDIGA